MESKNIFTFQLLSKAAAAEQLKKKHSSYPTPTKILMHIYLYKY